MRDHFGEQADDEQDPAAEDSPEDSWRPQGRSRSRQTGGCGAPAFDERMRSRSGGLDKREVVKQACSIVVRTLARDPQSYWRPIADALLGLELLQSSDTRYFLTRFSNICGGSDSKARELSHFLRLRLLGFNPWATRVEASPPGDVSGDPSHDAPVIAPEDAPADGAPTKLGLSKVPRGPVKDVVARTRQRRENAFAYYQRVRLNIGRDAWRKLEQELRGPIVFDHVFSSPMDEEDDGAPWSADQSEGSNHLEFEVERRRTGQLLHEVISQASADLRIGPVEMALLYSITERKDSGDEQQSSTEGLEVDLIGIPNRKLAEYMSEWGITLDVGYKTLEKRKRKLIEDLIAWCKARPELLKKLKDAMESLRELQADAWRADPVITVVRDRPARPVAVPGGKSQSRSRTSTAATAPSAAQIASPRGSRTPPVAPVTITRPASGQVEIVRFDEQGKPLPEGKEST